MPLLKRLFNILILHRATFGVCLALLGLFVSSCSDSRQQHDPPSPEEARGSAHPALKEKVTAPLPDPVPAAAGAG